MPFNPFTSGSSGTRNPNPVDAAQGSLYEEGMNILNTYEFEPGVCVLPLAEDPPTSEGELATWSPVVVMRLHAPYRVRRVKYSANKSTNPPVMPSPKDVGAFIFTGGGIAVHNVLNQSYQTFDWQMSSIYEFIENCPSRIEDGLVLGIPPWKWKTSTIVESTNPAMFPQVGAVALAGKEILSAKRLGDSITFDTPNSQTSLGASYVYNMPSYLPGGFFNDFLINGGVPFNQSLSQSQSQSQS